MSEIAGGKSQLSVTTFHGRALQSRLESVAGAGYDGAKRRKGTMVHIQTRAMGISHSVPCTKVSYSQGQQQDKMALRWQLQKRALIPRSAHNHYRETAEHGENAPAKGRKGDCTNTWQNQFRFV